MNLVGLTCPGLEPHGEHGCAPSDSGRGKNRFTEVSVPGKLGTDSGEALPFFARVRFERDRLLWYQVKIADTVVGSALAEAGRPEPHPFGAVLRKLMDNRGISVADMAVRTRRAMSTIHAVRAGGRNPHPVLVREIAGALDLSEADLAAVAGVDDATFGVAEHSSANASRTIT
jgi:hypothetical protein